MSRAFNKYISLFLLFLLTIELLIVLDLLHLNLIAQTANLLIQLVVPIEITKVLILRQLYDIPPTQWTNLQLLKPFPQTLLMKNMLTIWNHFQLFPLLKVFQTYCTFISF